MRPRPAVRSRAHAGTAYLDARVYALYDGIPALSYGAIGGELSTASTSG